MTRFFAKSNSRREERIFFRWAVSRSMATVVIAGRAGPEARCGRAGWLNGHRMRTTRREVCRAPVEVRQFHSL